MDVNKRFWAKVNKTDDCWLWMASGNKWGYGQFWYQGKFVGTHRMSYVLEYGSIPGGKVIHHTCHNRRCVRPDHLVALTRAEHDQHHLNRDAAIAATKKRYAERTECIRGHLLTNANTRVYTNTRGYKERRCRKCHREREARRNKE